MIFSKKEGCEPITDEQWKVLNELEKEDKKEMFEEFKKELELRGFNIVKQIGSWNENFADLWEFNLDRGKSSPYFLTEDAKMVYVDNYGVIKESEIYKTPKQ